MEYSIAVKMNELWLHTIIQIKNIMMSYKSQVKEEKAIWFHLHKVQKHSTLSITFRDAKSMVKLSRKTGKTAVAAKEGREEI